MTRLISAFRKLTTAAPQDENLLRRRIHELETENELLREKLAYRGPWMF